MPKRISVADKTPIRVVIVTMDSHLSGAAARAHTALRRDFPGLELSVHAADDWGTDDAALARCKADIARGDIILVTMMFLDEHARAVMPALVARRNDCDAMICCMSASEVVKLTRIGKFDMSIEAGGAIGWLKKLRGNRSGKAPGGKGEMKMLRQLPKLLRFIPGTAQDMRAYFLTLQYWLAGSEQNITNMVQLLVDRYADGPRRSLRGLVKPGAPIEYADIGVYHPRMKARISDVVDALPRVDNARGTVGLLLLRSYLIAGNASHYDGMIAAFEAKGLRVIPAFASGLDQRPAIERFFMKDGRSAVDAVVSLTGFSLVGGPAYNDSRAAEDILATLDVPYLAAHPVEFQTLEQWGASDRGLMPVESTIMVAIPELDGASGPLVFGGRSDGAGAACTGCDRACKFPPAETAGQMQVCSERAETLAARTARLVAMRRAERRDRKVAIVLFNFPPNAGNTGTAAFLAVFESLHRTLQAMKREGYQVECPDTADELRERIVVGNAARFGADANVHVRISANDHVRREKWLRQIEAQWGPAPGRQQSDGSSIFVLGERFGNVFVGIQPAFGYEGDPMRLLFEKGFAPTHAFSAFYRWLREDFAASAVLHFGTHGALEFMPGKQTGLSAACWPERMIGDLPNIYLYASNNPSEGTIAKRRSAATLISYLTPPVAHAGLYKGLVELKASIERWRGLPPDEDAERADLATIIQAQASALDLGAAEPAWTDAARQIGQLSDAVLELEYALIPHGLHVVGEPPSPEERVEMLQAVADASHGTRPDKALLEAIVRGDKLDASGTDAATSALLKELAGIDALLAQDHEIPSLIRALDGRFIRPAPGGDLLRTPSILPTGRNLHGFDPFRIPSVYAVQDGALQAQRLIDKHVAEGNGLPESVAIVLWGTDNLKNEGAPIGQALALLGAKPRFDGYGRLTGAELIPLDQLGRPRIDVIITMSGIFRDLLPLQIKLLAEACYLAATADEPVELNFVRKHTLAYQAAHQCDLETASLRVFGNADGAYGSNVNHLVENGRWDDEDELAETYTRRKSFAYGVKGQPVQQAALLKSALATVDLAYQNLDSVELGVTTVDHYFDTLGGISRAVRMAKGGTSAPVYIGDQTRGAGTVRTLSEQVALETRTRMLNPKWYEGMLKHGYEGVRQIEEHVTNTMGWSATTGAVAPWVYRQLTETFVLDPQMRDRLATLNPVASAKVANRLIEAHERKYWSPDPEMLDVLRKAGEELEDRLEGVGVAA
ncbi:magnesium chelatase subunit H [Bradyrhizobium sp. SSBR45G]|uniref:magnesium chelatase subunit H n=1 Tax=unclassified Bradyrhizobium TaxID=2631580 RepID=UPI002342BBF2|nr:MULTISPECIES: magnesium chelatase subunit H [unclassified Bradyrhizobium]GLH81731.1 magnesium chelatase subunit H [Bradyrhizobium sp. SSBR45G]GLH89149.1 magnesium chelatase subunit H [Bradyrhizobium sp. SSBR45R]